MKDGNIFRDFYSAVLMPVVSILVLIIVCISVTGLVRNVLKDRTEMAAVLRSVGLSSSGCGIYLAAELTAAAMLLAAAGLAVGSIVHIVIIEILNHVFHIELPYGMNACEYVKAVTVSPYAMPLLVIGIGTVVSVLLPLCRLVRLTPVMLFQGMLESGKSRRRKHRNQETHGKNWISLLNESIHLHDGMVALMMAVVMGAAFFGYTYFSAQSDRNTSSLRAELEEKNLGNRDYLSEKTSQVYMHNNNVENHHEYGVSPEALAEFSKNDFVEDAYGVIVNLSTKLTYEAGTQQDRQAVQLLQETAERFALGQDAYSISLGEENREEDQEKALYKGNEAQLSAMGYEEKENIYNVPTVGLSQELLESLEECVIDGTINWEQISEGAEIVVAVPERLAEQAAELFSVGELLPMSDIVLSKEEDLLNFGYILQAEMGDPVYEQLIHLNSGAEVEFSAYAFGQRKDIQTRIGAIAVIPEGAETIGEEVLGTGIAAEDIQEETSYEFMTELMYKDLAAYPVLVLCADQGAFQNWGLPDTLYTKVSAKVLENADVVKTDVEWYRSVGSASGMISSSVSDVKMEIQVETGKVMCIYYVVIVLLIIVGMTAIGISLYSRIRMNSTKIAHLRAVGMSMGQLMGLLIRQNMIYPVIGGICAVIPASLCQCFFYWITRQVDSGAWVWDGAVSNQLPWWFYVPHRYSLFSYHPIATVLVLIAVMIGMMALVTIPQLVYIRKQRIVEDLEKSSF